MGRHEEGIAESVRALELELVLHGARAIRGEHQVFSRDDAVGFERPAQDRDELGRPETHGRTRAQRRSTLRSHRFSKATKSSLCWKSLSACTEMPFSVAKSTTRSMVVLPIARGGVLITRIRDVSSSEFATSFKKRGCRGLPCGRKKTCRPRARKEARRRGTRPRFVARGGAAPGFGRARRIRRAWPPAGARASSNSMSSRAKTEEEEPTPKRMSHPKYFIRYPLS